jgi:hypothetical protein
MHMKGVILEDDQGREFVMRSQPPYRQMGPTYVLRGWQRRRLIPVRHSERELHRIAGEVLMALSDLFNRHLQVDNPGRLLHILQRSLRRADASQETTQQFKA